MLASNYLVQGSVMKPFGVGQPAWDVLTSINGMILLTLFTDYLFVALRSTVRGERVEVAIAAD